MRDDIDNTYKWLNTILEDHDYDPSWDYEVDGNPNKEYIEYCNNIMQEINTLIPTLKLGMGKASVHYIKNESDTVAVYAHGTGSNPVFMINLEEIDSVRDQLRQDDIQPVNIITDIKMTLFHEFAHAIQDLLELEYDEDEAEDFAISYVDHNSVTPFWEVVHDNDGEYRWNTDTLRYDIQTQ